MKITKAIYLNFNTTSVATAVVNVPFNVKTISTKAFAYFSEIPIHERYISISSDMVSDGALGITYRTSGSQISATNLSSNFQREFETPTAINGTYTFTLYDIQGNQAQTSGDGTGNDNAVLFVEFSSLV